MDLSFNGLGRLPSKQTMGVRISLGLQGQFASSACSTKLEIFLYGEMVSRLTVNQLLQVRILLGELRGRAGVARVAHNHKVVGASPTLATTL